MTNGGRIEYRKSGSDKRRKRTRPYIALLSAVLLSIVLFSSCSRGSDYLSRLKETEPPRYAGQEISQKRLEELKQGIEKYRAIVEKKVDAAGQLGVYYRMLASAYMDRQMFGEALDAVKSAIEIQPMNPHLFYIAGLSAAEMAKAQAEDSRRTSYLNDAQTYYERAVELDPGNPQYLYALSILYVFELNEPAKAEPLLQRLLEKRKRDARAMMVLARVYAMTGRTEQAADMYGEAADAARDPEVKQSALQNQRTLLQGAAK